MPMDWEALTAALARSSAIEAFFILPRGRACGGDGDASTKGTSRTGRPASGIRC